MNSKVSALEVLRDKFGYNQFRGSQSQIIEHILSGRSALVVMATGSGKSLCFQVPALVLPGLTVVISPLIALMQDQVDALLKKKIPATFINSSLDKQEREARMDGIKNGKFKMVYVTPERFRQESFWDCLQSQTISLLAVDEAHCISQWGHDFRPDYSRLGEIRERLGKPLTIALTATATERVRQDIRQQLDILETDLFLEPILRPNLTLNVHEVYGLDEKIRSIVGLSHLVPGPQIIYGTLIQSLYAVSRELAKLGLQHSIYHGQLPSSERKRVLRQFIAESAPRILATPAFGLGVDKPDIRLITHVEIPGSLEAYYQEVGRAGRDGLPSECHLLFDQDDVATQMEFIKWSNPDPGFIMQVYQKIARREGMLDQTGFQYLREQMNFYNNRDFRAETAVNLLERWGCLEEDRSYKFPYRAVSEPTLADLDQKLFETRLRSQNQRLYDLAQWLRLGPEERIQRLMEYFG